MAKTLAELDRGPSNTVAPAASQGLTLTEKAKLPIETFPPDLAYVEFTTDVTVSGTEGAPTDVVSSGELILDGRPVWVEFNAYGLLTSATAADAVVINLWDGATDLGRWALAVTPAAAAMAVPVHARRRITPAVGSHTYKVRAWKATNNGTVRATGTFPGYIRVTYAPL
jgi:hypothetical protein